MDSRLMSNLNTSLLCAAIIERACMDYYKVCQKPAMYEGSEIYHLKRNCKFDEKRIAERLEIKRHQDKNALEEFFNGDLFNIYSGVNGRKLMDGITKMRNEGRRLIIKEK